MSFLEIVRKEYAHLDTFYFNSAYFGPSPYRVKQKVSNALFKELDPSFFPYNTWVGIPDRVRRLVSKLLETKSHSVCFHNSMSDINNIIMNGYPFKKGDLVCSLEEEYPSNVIPYMLGKKINDVEFKLLPSECFQLEHLKKHLPKETKIFILSHVSFFTGKKTNLLEIGKFLKQRDILFVVDTTQALGGLKITPKELELIDVLGCSTYKWMLGPYGMAFAYFSDHAQKLIQHTSGNWLTSPNSKNVYSLMDYTTETIKGARKYDRGQTPNLLAMACFEGSLDFLLEVGLENIQKHNNEIRNYFLENFPKKKMDLITPQEHMGNIVCLKTKGIKPIDLETELRHNNIDVSVREGNIRLSFHIFNTKNQINRLLGCLDI